VQDRIGKLSEYCKRVGFLQRGRKEDGNGARKETTGTQIRIFNSIFVLPALSQIALLLLRLDFKVLQFVYSWSFSGRRADERNPAIRIVNGFGM
jgi:hypothetical protein